MTTAAISTLPARFAASYEIAKDIGGMSSGLSRIFLPLSVMNKAYVEEVAPANQSSDLKRFFDYISRNFSDHEYAKIQSAHLNTSTLRYIKEQNWISPAIKFIDFPFWIASKFAVARKLRLHELSGLKVLDLGAGPGHLGAVCDYFGHQFLGLDIPMSPTVPGTSGSVFHDLCNFFKITRVFQRIQPGVPLGLRGRFDVVTTLMGNFNVVHEMDRVARPWNWEEWRFLLNDLLTNHATPNIRMYFQINQIYMPPEVASKLEALAVEFHPAAMVFVFDATLFERLHAAE